MIGFSGGLDSTVLLHLAAAVRAKFSALNLIAAHVHHGLSPNADAWSSHCRQVAQQLGVEFVSANVQIEAESRQSLEALARQARYQAFAELAPEGADLLLGQHLDDQVETLLLQLKRGAGPRGLGAMASQGSWQRGRSMFRPLLSLTRAELEAYARSNKLAWIEDESNRDTRFDRNFLRRHIIPMLKERWPGSEKALARSAELCAEQEQMLAEVRLERLQHCLVNDSELDLKPLLSMNSAWRRGIVREWLRYRGAELPSQAILAQIEAQCFESAEDAQLQIQWQGWQVRRYQQRLYLLDNPPADWDGEYPLVQGRPQGLPTGAPAFVLTASAAEKMELQNAVTVPKDAKLVQRFGGLGARFKPKGAKQGKPLKQWMKHWGIPPWERQSVPLLFAGDSLVAVGRFAVGEAEFEPSNQLRVFLLAVQ